jgi:hypothetical protein
MSQHRRPWRAPVAALFLMALVPAALGCGGGGPAGAVEPVAAPTTATPQGDVDAGADSDRSTTAAPSTSAGTDDGSGAAAGSDPPGEIAALLAAFDRAVTALAADPARAGRPGDELVAALRAVVRPGTVLESDVLTRIAVDAQANRMRIEPGPDGLSYRHVATSLSTAADGSVAWDNCGYSPGVGIHMDTGEVLDDRRASTRGWGRAEPGPDGALVLVELVDEPWRMLDPGEADPCAALVGP